MILVIEVIATSISGKVEKGDGGGGVGEGSRYDSCMKVMRKCPI